MTNTNIDFSTEIIARVYENRASNAYPLLSEMSAVEREFKKVLNADTTMLDVSHLANVVEALYKATFKMCGYLTGAQEMEHALLEQVAIALTKYFDAVTKNKE